MRYFYSWDETAQRLGTDDEGLRQSLGFGPMAIELFAFVRTSELGFIATIQGVEKASPYDSFEPVLLSDGRTLDAWSGNDNLCSWSKQESSTRVTGFPAVYLLSGYFRVSPDALRQSARDGFLGGLQVSPLAWWAVDSPVPLKYGEPEPGFFLLNRGTTGDYRPPPKELKDLQFLAVAVDELASRNEAKPPTDGGNKSAQSKPPRSESGDSLPTRERNSLLRIIRSLDVMANLPERGAATSIEAQLQVLGFDGPGEDTIRKVIADARALKP